MPDVRVVALRCSVCESSCGFEMRGLGRLPVVISDKDARDKWLCGTCHSQVLLVLEPVEVVCMEWEEVTFG